MTRWPGALAALALLAGCRPGGPAEDSAAPPAREPMPAVALDTVEAPVAELIRGRQNLVRALERSQAPDAGRLATAYGQLGDVYQVYGFFDAAESAYVNATRLRPEVFESWYYLGRARKERGALDDAADAWGAALALRPRDVPTLVRLAEVERLRGRPERSRELSERALGLDERQAVAHYLLGQLASAAHDWAAAARHYEAALALEPWASKLRYPLATAYGRLGRAEEAQAELARRGTREPSLPDPYLQRLGTLRQGVATHLFDGSQAMQAGRLADAIREFTLARDGDPSNPSARLNLGAALAQAGRLDEARPELEAALELGISPADRSKTHFNLAVLHQMAGRREKAIENFRAAVRWDPANAPARQRLAALESERH